jgi:hypothetical protein
MINVAPISRCIPSSKSITPTGVGRIQRASGLIGKDDLRLVDDRPSHRSALSLPAGEMVGQPIRQTRQAEVCEHRKGLSRRQRIFR